MSEDLLRQTLQRGGCRLCMSPDSECVSIFSTAAADKEPLSSKILACVSIKVHQADRMSARICHACISYLNSWQSFKNRCYAAQKRQRSQLEEATKQPERPAAVSILKPQHKVMNQQQILQHAAAAEQKERALQRLQLQQQRILKTALLSGKPPVKPAAPPPQPTFKPGAVDVSFIKDEPIDPDTEMQHEDDEEDIVDPMQFLANDGEYNDTMDNDDGSIPMFEDGEEAGENGGPPILTSLGLTHINHNSEYGGDTTANEGDLDESSSMPPPYSLYRPLPPHCTICRMKFSNRANARRHERNIHGKVIDQGTAAAMLQLSRNQQISITAPVRTVSLSHDSNGTPPPRQRPSAAEPRLFFDYDNPQQYRELITDSKLYFIKRNIEFLEQYQTMTCKCCDRTYPTYKLFMAHMRKKYDNLSRNLCFKCLKQFDTKSLFIGHLKKKNCINLYRVYRSDPSISKDPLPSNHKAGTKEIIGNKVYGCKLCEKTFRLKVDFRTHVNFDHVADQRREHSANGCAYCDIVFEDGAARKRHFNNLECIVFLICGTCDDKFDTLTMYIEHVYAEHLPQAALNSCKPEELMPTISSEITITKEEPTIHSSSESDANTNGLRNPHNCTVCDKRYNNYYNMLRHMESKHPNDLPLIYRCEVCQQGFPRQVDVREHMASMHGIKLKRDQTYACRQCSDSFELKDAWLEHQATRHTRYACYMCDMDTENRAEFDEHLKEHSTGLRGNQCTICEHSFNSERGLETHLNVVHGIRKTPLPKSVPNRSSIDDAVTKEKLRLLNRQDEDDADDRHDEYRQDHAYMREDEEDGHDADMDETIEHPVKRPKFELRSPNVDSNGIRKCKLCQETFLGNIALANHMRTHGIVSSRPGVNKAAVHRFQRIQPSATIKTKVISRMRCRICQKRIHTKTSYKRHMLNIHGVRDCVFIKCTVCPAEFSNDKGLKVHMFRTHHISVHQMQQDVRIRPVVTKESTSADPVKMFECDICHTVYRSNEQMQSHQLTVHGIEAGEVIDVKPEPISNDEMEESVIEEQFDPTTVWWQCRYCDETFNASKKLTIHMNGHEEHDTTDNTCIDCGNVYRTRKSLWVHRHKKHPRHPNPSPCEICTKVFFDKTELMHHLRTHTDTDVFPHLSEMQAQLAEEHQQQQMHGAEELACHVCGQTFYDKRVLSKHLRTHEASGGAENGVAETTTAEYSYPSYQGQMVDGEYACDMCPKTFPLITALKVHRGWHFRSPDGRQVTDTGNMWQPDMGRGSAAAAAAAALVPAFKRSRSGGPRIPSCPYCSSTFASGNNLRRHIVEVHKRSEARKIRENGTFSETVTIEKELECRMCDITFSNHAEWVDHKISHARTMKPSTNFEWGCEICGRIFTRKERLLAHMSTHLSGKRMSSGQNSDAGDGGNSNSMSSSSQTPSNHMGMSRLRQQLQKPLGHPGTADAEEAYGDDDQDEYIDGDEQMGEEEDDEEERYGEEVEEEEDEEDVKNVKMHRPKNGQSGSASDEEEDEEATENEPDDEMAPVPKRPAAYSCDLCQVFFKTAKELRRHVTSHIINGPELPAAATASAVTESSPVKSAGSSKLDGFNCRLCGSSSESHIDMIACMESHKVVTNLRCGECKLYFADADQVLDHENLCHPKPFEA